MLCWLYVEVYVVGDYYVRMDDVINVCSVVECCVLEYNCFDWLIWCRCDWIIVVVLCFVGSDKGCEGE